MTIPKTQRLFWRRRAAGSVPTVSGVQRVPSAPIAFTAPYPIVHCAHHKVGTVWFGKVMGHVARETGIGFSRLPRSQRVADLTPGLYLDPHSAMTIRSDDVFRGSHLVRDPRDIVVSGYRYHLRSSELWLHRPIPEFHGQTYQERLNSLPREEGLALEIARSAQLFRMMRCWDYDDPRVLEFRYEDVFGNDEHLWRTLMTHWGLEGDDLERAVEIGVHHAYRNVKARAEAAGSEPKHLGKGAPKQWQDEFTPALIDLIEEAAGDLITRLGYR